MMFPKLSALAVLLPLVNALSITTPTNLTSGGPATISWTTSAGDPSVWTLELVNIDIFHNSFAISNNVNPSLGTISLELPSVPPGPGYTIQAVNITNINQIFAQTGSFTVAPTVSSTSSSAASSTSSGLTSSSGVTASTTSGASAGSSSSTPFGTTLSGSSTSGSSASSSVTGSGTSSSGSATPTNFNGAPALGFSSLLAMVAAAIAGGVVVA